MEKDLKARKIRLTSLSMEQNISSIINEFFDMENLVLDRKELKIYAISRLVTIIEQFCRNVIAKQIDSGNIENINTNYILQRNDFKSPASLEIIYDKIHKYYKDNISANIEDSKIEINIKDLHDSVIKSSIPITVGYMIALTYRLQNIDNIKNALKNHGLKYNINNEMKNLFKLRHDFIHTINYQRYDFDKIYNVTKEFIKDIFDISNYGVGYFEILYGGWLYDSNKYDKVTLEYNKLLYRLQYIIDIHHKKIQIDEYNDVITNDQYVKLLQLKINLAVGYRKKGVILLGHTKYTKVLSCYTKSLTILTDALRLCPNNLDIIHHINYHIGLILVYLDRPNEAVKYYNNAILNKELFIDAHINVADILNQLSCHSEANQHYKILVDYYDKSLRYRPEHAEYYYKKGLMLFNLKKYDDAIICYKRAIQLKPNHIDVYIALCDTLQMLNHTDHHNDIMEYYNTAISIDNDNISLYESKAAYLESIDKFDDAIKCYDKILKIDSGNMDAYYGKSICYDSMSIYDEAIDCYDKAIKITPYDEVLYYNKSLLLDELCRYDEAIDCCNKIMNLGLDDKLVVLLGTYLHKGDLLCKQHNYSDAIKCYDVHLSNLPNYEVYVSKGYALSKLENYDKAMNCYDLAINYYKKIQHGSKLPARMIMCYVGKGNILKHKKKYNEAINCYNLVLSNRETNAEANMNKGHALFLLKKYSDAKKYYDKALNSSSYFFET